MPIRITRFGPIVSKFSEIAVGKVVRESFDALGSKLVPILEAEAPEASKKFKKSIRYRITRVGLNTALTIYSNAAHAKQIEEGRPAGKKGPPPKALLAWVKRKGLGAKAQSVKTRRSLAVGIRRSFNRKEGKLRTRVQSLNIIQKGIAFAIGRSIAREGLPRKTGFKPSHKLYFFRDIERRHAAIVNDAYRQMEARLVKTLNG